MNPDELRQLFADNLDEPPLPADPVGSVRRRRLQLQTRRRLLTMTVVLALAGAAGGIWSVLPGGGHSQSGPSVLDEDTRTSTPTPGAPTTHPPDVAGMTRPALAPTPLRLVSPRTVPASSRATATATATTAPASAPVDGLTFAWSVSKTDASTVLMSGSWTGEATTASDALLADPNRGGAEAGSGVLDYMVTTVGASHQPLPTPNGDDTPPGGAPSCDGPVVAQHHALQPILITYDQAGTYPLTMRSNTCSADGHLVQSDVTTTVTVGDATDDFHTALSVSGGASVTLGARVQLAASGNGPFSPATGLMWVLSPDGVFHVLDAPATLRTCSTGTSASTTTSLTYTPAQTGKYTFGYAYGCDVGAGEQGQHADLDFQSAQSVVVISVVPASTSTQ